ncbi:MAG: tail fiber protein [Anaerolineae bacterium]|nr:tail fiber protein [Anaerolineae bacterium]
MSGVTSEPDTTFIVDFARRYVAPPGTPTTRRCRRVLIPDAPQFVEAVNEVLALLTYPDVWQDGDGTLTAQECAILMATMWNEYRKDQLCMLGVIVPIATNGVPDGMLLCDGSAYQKDDYPDLFAVINPNLILDASTFKTPDLRGRFIMADGDAGHPEYTIGGEYEHPLTQSEIPYHQHLIDPHDHTSPPHYHSLIPGFTFNLDLEAPGAPDIFGAGVTLSTDTTPAVATINPTGYLTANGVGGDQAHNTTPPYFVLRYAMVAR